MPTLSIDPRNTQVSSDAENIELLYQATEFPEGQTVVPAFSLVIGFDSDEVDLDEAAIAASLPAGASLVTTPPPQIEDTDNLDGNDDTNQLLILSIQNLPVTEEQQTLLTIPIITAIDLDEAPVTFDVGTEITGVDVEAIPTVTIAEEDDGDGNGNGNGDGAPVFNPDAIEVSIDENSEEGVLIADLNATDPDDDEITYTITGGNDDLDGDVVEPFVIDSETGEITINDSGDLNFEFFEEEPVIELTAAATDPDGNSDETTVTITLDNIDEPPDLTDTVITIPENTEEGFVVASLESPGPEDEEITYEITEGNEDFDGDGEAAFAIDPANGEVTINDSGDIDVEAFEGDPVFELTATATDPGGNSSTATVTVELTNVAALDISEDNDGVLSLTDLDGSLLVTPVATEVTTVNEVGFFLVDENGDIVVDEEGDDAEAETLSPGDDGYLDAALEDAGSLFSVLNNPPPGFDANAVERILERTTGENLGFFVVNNGTVEEVLAGVEREGLEVNLSTDPDSEIEISEADDGGFDISLGEGLAVNAQATSDDPTPGTDLQDEVLPELFDLREFDDTVALSATLTREADFDTVVGLYEVANASGAAIDPVTGDTIDTTAANYLEVVLENAIEVGSVADEETATFDFELAGGALYAPFILVQGSESEEFEEIYTPFLGANSDGVDHIRLLGDNTVGFEDLPSGGDLDYNDVVAEIAFA